MLCLLVPALMALAMVSCSKDSDESSNKPTDLLVGTWKVTQSGLSGNFPTSNFYSSWANEMCEVGSIWTIREDPYLITDNGRSHYIFLLNDHIDQYAQGTITRHADTLYFYTPDHWPMPDLIIQQLTNTTLKLIDYYWENYYDNSYYMILERQ